jgi:hypothetical protein
MTFNKMSDTEKNDLPVQLNLDWQVLFWIPPGEFPIKVRTLEYGEVDR